MSASALKLNLPSVDDLFTTQEARDEQKYEKVLIVPAEEVFPYVRQPYNVERLTKDLVAFIDSVGRRGIEQLLIVRPRQAGGYEIISGHRRDYCGKLHHIPERPVIVREYTDDDADILVADFNIVREEPLPSELARAYKLRYDAMKRQGQCTDLRESLTSGQIAQKLEMGTNFHGDMTSGQIAQKSRSNNARKKLAAAVGKKEDEARRYLDLNKLIPELLQVVDEGKIKVRFGSKLSSLLKNEQRIVAELMELEDCTPSIPQALRLKELPKSGQFTEVKNSEQVVKLFVRFALVKGVLTYGLRLMVALFNIVQGVVSNIIIASGFGSAS